MAQLPLPPPPHSESVPKLIRPRRLLLVLLCCGFILLVLLALASPATAQEAFPPPPSPGIANETCLECHGTPDMVSEFPSGEPHYLTVDRITYRTSTHGQQGYACVQCHTDIIEVPHRPNTAQTQREYTLWQNDSCERCHQDKFDATQDSVHAQAMEAGNPEAAVCTDCHGAHDVGPPGPTSEPHPPDLRTLPFRGLPKVRTKRAWLRTDW